MSMKSKKYLFLIILSTLVLLSSTKKELPELRIPSYKIKLSDYGFFEGKLSEQIPSSGVVPYALNAPLFSDYAYKLRFVSFPEAAAVIFNPDSVFQFPIGTALIKTFFYYQDERNVKKGRRTRICLRNDLRSYLRSYLRRWITIDSMTSPSCTRSITSNPRTIVAKTV